MAYFATNQMARFAWLGATLMALSRAAAAQPPNVAAAQVELLTLRTAVPHRVPVRRDSLWLETSPDPVSLDSAARALMALSKPTVCGAKPERAMIRVKCQRLQDLSAYDIGGALVVRYGGEFGSVSGGGGLLGDVRRYHPSGIDTLRAMCTGRDTLIVPVVAMEIWQRDYYEPIFDTSAFPYNMSGSGDLEHDGQSTAFTRQHDIISTFKFSASFNDTTSWATIISRDRSGGPPSAKEEFQMSQLVGIAQSLMLGADEAELRPALAKIAQKFEEYWAGHGTMPPEAIAFLNRYGQ